MLAERSTNPLKTNATKVATTAATKARVQRRSVVLAPAVALADRAAGLGGDRVTGLARGAVAQRAALLMQGRPLELPLAVREAVEPGQRPHLRRFETERVVEPREEARR